MEYKMMSLRNMKNMNFAFEFFFLCQKQNASPCTLGSGPSWGLRWLRRPGAEWEWEGVVWTFEAKGFLVNIITETESNYECKRKHYMNHSISRGVFLEALNGWFSLEYWLKICWILANREYEEYGKSAFSGRPFDGQVGQTEELFQQCLSTWFNVPTFLQCLSAL